MKIYINNKNDVYLIGYTDTRTGQPINDGSLVFDLLLGSSVVLSSQQMAYIDGSIGDYVGEIGSNVSLAEGRTHEVVVRSTDGDFEISGELPAIKRKFC